MTITENTEVFAPSDLPAVRRMTRAKDQLIVGAFTLATALAMLGWVASLGFGVLEIAGLLF